MGEKITIKNAVSLMKRAVKERGEKYRDPNSEEEGCVYFTPTGQPSCIIGHMMYYMGWRAEDLGGYNTYGVNTIPDGLEIIDNDLGLWACLSSAQESQDHGYPWGEILTGFKEDLGVE